MLKLPNSCPHTDGPHAPAEFELSQSAIDQMMIVGECGDTQATPEGPGPLIDLITYHSLAHGRLVLRVCKWCGLVYGEMVRTDGH